MSTSATSFKATRAIEQFRRHQGDNNNDDDYMQTFVALQEEKRMRLLDPQLSKQQMNDFDRRLYTVVQRMSAFDRYRRKRTTTTQITTIPILEEHHHYHHQASQPIDSISKLQAEINDDWKRLISNLQNNAKIYRQWANQLPGQQPTVETQEQPQQQASPFDVQRNAFRDAIMGLLKSPEQQMRDEERLKLFKEHMRMEEARLEEQRVRYALERQIRVEQERAEAAERSRFALAQTAQRALEAKRDQERQEEKSRLYRRIAKREENDTWATEWRNRRRLIVQRRANQSANAG